MKKTNILLLSDSTGETVNNIASSLAAQFGRTAFTFDLVPFLRTLDKVEQIVIKKYADNNIILHTLVESNIKAYVNDTASKANIEVIEVLSLPMKRISTILGYAPSNIPGKQYQVNENYFKRINAIDFAMYTDDGLTGERLLLADVIILGISRTSKTPTCIYLAYQGIRAANLPLIHKQGLPTNFEIALKKHIPMVGLIASVSRLQEVRSNRLKAIGSPELVSYIDRKKIQEELIYARLLFERYKIPIIDVTRRSIEETAATIKDIIK
jgi:hypothetical protein